MLLIYMLHILPLCLAMTHETLEISDGFEDDESSKLEGTRRNRQIAHLARNLQPPVPRPSKGVSVRVPEVQLPIQQSSPSPTEQLASHLHTPHLDALDVACSKDRMVVRLKFSHPWNGIVYSKGYYNTPSCRFVSPNSNKQEYEFPIRLDACGSQFIENFSTDGKAYLENTLVLQNEPGILEVWDSSRKIQCLWEGQIKKVVSTGLSIDQLDHQVVQFSGDAVQATLDIQLGRGPFAPSANGLVKIGETMTMVVKVEGDAEFDVQIRECVAHSGTKESVVYLSDVNGCILKPKLMGTWALDRQNGLLIAYSFFQAFKFPDIMEVFLECVVELCKTHCSKSCSTETLNRGKRSLTDRKDEESAVKLSRHIRVISPEDVQRPSVLPPVALEQESPTMVCMEHSSFVSGLVGVFIMIFASCVITAIVAIKVHRSRFQWSNTSQLPCDSVLHFPSPVKHNFR